MMRTQTRAESVLSFHQEDSQDQTRPQTRQQVP